MKNPTFESLIILIGLLIMYALLIDDLTEERVAEKQESTETVDIVPTCEECPTIVVSEILTVCGADAEIEEVTEEDTEEAKTYDFLTYTSNEEPTEVETEIAEAKRAYYSVDGAVLDFYLQDYLHDQLEARGVVDEYIFTICLCEIYQESRFNPNADNGIGDKGLCQFREKYFAERAQASGLYEWDIWNPIDCLYVYAWQTAENLNATGWNVAETLKRYYNSGNQSADEQYVRDVLQWLETTGGVER